MCGRFSLTTPLEELIQQFLLDEIVDEWNTRYNVAPSQNLLSIISNKGKRKAGPIKWGLIPSWVKERKKWKPLINARSESVTEKVSFNRLLDKRRTVILADSFYEWKKIDGQKVPMRFTLKNNQPFAFAGLWDRNVSGTNKIVTSTILTTKANELVEPVHDRMPVILTNHSDMEKWLNTQKYSFNHAAEVLRPLPADEMISYQVSEHINSPKNDSIECIQKLE